jgi:hypothetical protein
MSAGFILSSRVPALQAISLGSYAYSTKKKLKGFFGISKVVDHIRICKIPQKLLAWCTGMSYSGVILWGQWSHSYNLHKE